MSTLSDLLRARYGQTTPPTVDSSNATIATLLGHRSVRAYRPDPLPAGTLELIIAAAQSASTSSNVQAWSVVAVEESARKARLAVLARDQRHIHEAPLFLVWLADLSRLRRAARRADTPSAGLDYTEAFLLGVIDATLAAQNAAVAAESFGLGTVYIGAIRNEPEKVATELGLPPEVFPVFGLVVGYPDTRRPAAEIKPRLPQAAVLHREVYSTDAEAGALAAYDTTLAAFQKSQNLPVNGWTQPAGLRVRDAAALGSRARLTEAITTLGFKLR